LKYSHHIEDNIESALVPCRNQVRERGRGKEKQGGRQKKETDMNSNDFTQCINTQEEKLCYFTNDNYDMQPLKD